MSPPKARYPIAAEDFRTQIEVEKSRFIASLRNVTDLQAAQDFVTQLKSEFPDANHNCWAYLIGPPGSSDRIGLSDDGEPHGCAGKPLLTCLQHSGLGDIAVVVTRYFGGIKLGKGGMVKAYTAAVQAALDQLPRAERIDWSHAQIQFDYALLDSLKRRLPEFEAEILEIAYTDCITLQIRVPEEHRDPLQRMFDDLSAGRGEFKLHQKG